MLSLSTDSQYEIQDNQRYCLHETETEDTTEKEDGMKWIECTKRLPQVYEGIFLNSDLEAIKKGLRSMGVKFREGHADRIDRHTWLEIPESDYNWLFGPGVENRKT